MGTGPRLLEASINESSNGLYFGTEDEIGTVDDFGTEDDCGTEEEDCISEIN
jgi:hypothetical protein